MRVEDIRNIARERGIKTGKLTKGELIRTIQREEGNNDCFGLRASLPCDQSGCLWRADCRQD